MSLLVAEVNLKGVREEDSNAEHSKSSLGQWSILQYWMKIKKKCEEEGGEHGQ